MNETKWDSESFFQNFSWEKSIELHFNNSLNFEKLFLEFLMYYFIFFCFYIILHKSSHCCFWTITVCCRHNISNWCVCFQTWVAYQCIKATLSTWLCYFNMWVNCFLILISDVWLDIWMWDVNNWFHFCWWLLS